MPECIGPARHRYVNHFVCLAFASHFLGSSLIRSSGDGIGAKPACTNQMMKAASVHQEDQSSSPTRSYATNADKYFRKHQRIPSPRISHDNLDRLLRLRDRHYAELEEKSQADYSHSSASPSCNNKILIIGDVHGCIAELKLLIENAIHEHNQSQNFRAIIIVGDLVNKGPQSAEVVKFVRTHHNIFTVRGNHDDRALAAALGDKECTQKPKYDWVKSGLGDEDVEWLAELPYTITIPSNIMQQCRDCEESTKDVIVVHAGLLPNVSLEDQNASTMTTIRYLISVDESAEGKGSRQNIAKAWKGPEEVIFGHDAKQGLQIEEHAIGLDTGCVYGKQLTGIILPQKEFVSVDALEEYSPIIEKD